ncbi:MAG: CoA transferase [Emcibacter sp.]|nr:CoA transferase [Emcibacter sp.]
MSGPLEGVKVIEFTSVVLGPWACQILGDMGAEVIKVEPPTGDTNRHLGPRRNNDDMSALFLTCNRNKRSIVLDLKQPEGKAAALKLVAQADVMIHNFRPQAMGRLGLDYDSVKAENPEIIYCATYGYSKNGPYGDKGALDDSIQAGSGIAMLMSMVEGEPRYLPTILADKTTGMAVVNAVTAALFYKERHGKGQEIEIPMYETMVSFVMVEHLWGQTFEPPIGKAGYVRLMSKHRRPYKTKDGYIAVLPYWDNHWKTFCEVVERPDMLTDPRFKDMKTRLANIDVSYAETGKALAKKTTAEWLVLLKPTNVPHMVVNTLDDLVDDPHLKQSGFWQMVDHPTEGKLRMAKTPYGFSETPLDIRRLPPRLGQQSEEILREVGYDEDQIQQMFTRGITKGPSS